MNNDSFYKPSGSIKDTNRTYVPDIYRQVAAEMLEEDNLQKQSTVPANIVRIQKRPLIGVLYSISAGIDGELFPLYVGRNTIGSDMSCDICLRESSVSAQHGILLARKQTNAQGEEYISVTLSDTNSSYGTCVNGERLNFEKLTCSNGDIISIGQNYVLVLSLFNALGKLSVAYAFDRIPNPKKADEDTPSLIHQTENAIDGIPASLTDDHSANITREIHEEASVEFYKPTKQQIQDHYNNKTIIL
ncbi:MAG: FHA domain-containing protein [Prevotella sp.]|nr:FHA domain-containing protein [Prevotella sp.]